MCIDRPRCPAFKNSFYDYETISIYEGYPFREKKR